MLRGSVAEGVAQAVPWPEGEGAEEAEGEGEAVRRGGAVRVGEAGAEAVGAHNAQNLAGEVIFLLAEGGVLEASSVFPTSK